MIRLIKNDLKICISSKRYQYIVLSFYTFLILTFLRYSMGNFGKSSLEIMPTYNMGMVLSINRNNIRSVYIIIIFLLPLLSSLFYSDSIRNEKSSGIYNYYVTRCTIKKHFLSKIITTFLLNTLTIFFSVASSELLIWLSIPNIGCQYMNTTPIYEYITQKPHIFCYKLFNFNPYLYVLFIVLILSIYSGLIGVISMSISLLFTKLKNNYLYIVTFLSFYLIEIIVPIRYSINAYLQTYPSDVKYFITTLLGFITITFICIILSIWKEGRR